MAHPIVQSLKPLGPLGGSAVVLCAVAGVAIVWNAALLGQAIAQPGKIDDRPEAAQKERISAYEASLDKRVAQYAGRSVFVAPRAPKAPDPAEAKKDEKPVAPTVYAGPGIVAMVYDRVWFDDGRSLALGDPEDSGLAVVDVSPPWAARLRWRGVEFDVTLFSRTTTEFLEKPSEDAKASPDATGAAAGGSDK